MDYPDENEEFELMYGDELELIRDQEDEELMQHNAGPNSKRSLEFSKKQKSTTSQPNDNMQIDLLNQPSTSGTKLLDSSFDKDFTMIEQNLSQITKKRNIEDLFGDIDDLLREEISLNKTKKKRMNDDELLIQYIQQNRILIREKQNPNIFIHSNTKRATDIEHLKHNLSYRVPKYPFIPITRHDGERIYIRMHSEEYMKEELQAMSKSSTYTGLMGSNFKEIWNKAQDILNNQLDRKQKSAEAMDVSESEPAINQESQLWVDLYKPRRYLELLSDESTNRTLLMWMKLWDKVVFRRKPKVKPAVTNQKQPLKFFKKKVLDTTLDEHDRPMNKIALLCGPPGLGKTTLAHIVARHAGYNVVEINASDERNVEAFRTTLENSTQMKSVIDHEHKPNCVIFDEIDGAPAASIEFLIKFINGIARKARKGKKNKPQILKRPIICICNDVYVPALRPLRQVAFVLNFPPISSAKLAERLMFIAKSQQINTDLVTMITLSEKTNNDIRACLAVLHFFKAQKKKVTISEIQSCNVGLKDIQKGLFAVWDDIFTINRKNFYRSVEEEVNLMSMKVRMQNILNTVQSFGDYERVAMGIFENYGVVKNKSDLMLPTCEALDWFCLFDNLNRRIHETQNYVLSSYLPYGFVTWHFVFASMVRRKLIYPSSNFEAISKLNKRTALIAEVMKGMSLQTRPYVNKCALKVDILPLISDILIPKIKSTNLTLYGNHEREEIHRIVCSMIDYNLTYIQERTLEGSYIFKIDPDIHDIGQFPLNIERAVLPYAIQQIVSREIEVEKMRRLDPRKSNEEKEKDANNDNLKEQKKMPVIPNHLQRLKTNTVVQCKQTVSRDFFGRIVTKPVKTVSDYSNNAGDVWYKFKEGYSNAVRRHIKMKSLQD